MFHNENLNNKRETCPCKHRSDSYWKVFWEHVYVLLRAFGKLISIPLLVLPVPQGDATNGFSAQEAHGSILPLDSNNFTKVFLSGLRPWNQFTPSIALISVPLRHHTKYKPGSFLWYKHIVHRVDGSQWSIVKALCSASPLRAPFSALGRECRWKHMQRLRH